MPMTTEYRLRSYGWENDPETEEFKLATIDFLTTTTYTNMVVFFKLQKNEDKSKVVAVIKEGLERTLSQIRHLVGTTEPDGHGSYSILRRRGQTVNFVVQHLDGPEDKFPSFAEVDANHYRTAILGDIRITSNVDYMFGKTAFAHPKNSPPMASFKANFIPGGLLLHIFTHHFTNGILGWMAMVRQIQENCYAAATGSPFPSFDLRNLDRSPYPFLGFDSRPALSSTSSKAAAQPPPVALRPRQVPVQSLIFHLPKSRGAELKKYASPPDTQKTWISTLNAVCALMWRVFSRIREPLYNTGRDFKPLFGTGVSFQKFFPESPDRLQLNFQYDITSADSPLPQFTLGEVISDAPLWKIATYTRDLADSVTIDMLTERLAASSRSGSSIEDLSISVPAFPPMAVYVTDWRVADFRGLDFGFGETMALRSLFGNAGMAQRGQVVVYAPRTGPRGDDEGMELQLTFEAELVPLLLKDEEWSRFFEFRGVDIWDEESVRNKTGSKL